MESVAVGMVLAFLGGACVAVCNAWITGAKWFQEGARLYACFFVRQTLNVAYLVGLYLLAPLLPWIRRCCCWAARWGSPFRRSF